MNLQSTTFEPIRQWMQGRQQSRIDEIVRWCDQNSWSRAPDRLSAMAEMLCQSFAEIGVQFERQLLGNYASISDDGQWHSATTGPALLWHHHADAERRILLMIHYDTVYPFSADAPQTVVSDDRLVGPGTVDAKGGIAVIALAIEGLLKFGIPENVGVSILLNPDEEIGSPASADLMKTLVPQFDAALLFEPPLPDGSLVSTRKGSGNYAVTVTGRSAHSGRNIDEGRNAVVQAAKIATQIAALHAPDTGLLVNVGHIAGGGPLNQVPANAVVQMNVRVATTDAADAFVDLLGAITASSSTGGFEAQCRGSFHAPPKVDNSGLADIQRRVERAGRFVARDIRWQPTGGACDGCKLAAWGLPNIDTMGIAGGNLHHPDEFCLIDSLIPAAMTVVAFVRQFGDSETLESTRLQR